MSTVKMLHKIVNAIPSNFNYKNKNGKFNNKYTSILHIFCKIILHIQYVIQLLHNISIFYWSDMFHPQFLTTAEASEQPPTHVILLYLYLYISWPNL